MIDKNNCKKKKRNLLEKQALFTIYLDKPCLRTTIACKIKLKKKLLKKNQNMPTIIYLTKSFVPSSDFNSLLMVR